MHLQAHDCRERASEVRELARRAKNPSAKKAFEQTAEYWLGLAERLEHEERKSICLPEPIIHSDRMPVVGYLLSVGMVLMLGLVFLSPYFETRPDRAARLSQAPATASLIPVAPSQRP
jgi:hypothetical protein